MDYGYIKKKYVKLSVGPLRNILVTTFDTIRDFDEEVSKDKYCRYSALVGSYRNYEQNCLYVAIFRYREIEKPWLLDWKNEEMKEPLYPGQMLSLKDSKHLGGSIILELVMP